MSFPAVERYHHVSREEEEKAFYEVSDGLNMVLNLINSCGWSSLSSYP